MQRTPDEIKKGLEFCGGDCFNGNEECPYDKDDLRENISCIRWMAQDALAYIRQLERERDALLEIVRNEADCKVCKHLKEECDGDCSFCEIEEPCLCNGCTKEYSRWKWAGIKEDNP